MSLLESPLSLKQARTSWYKSLVMLYAPVVIAVVSHVLVYPVLAGVFFAYAARKMPYRSVLRDRYAAKLLFGFVASSFIFLLLWMYSPLPWLKQLASLAYLIFGVLFSKKLERLAYMIWRKARSSYHM